MTNSSENTITETILNKKGTQMRNTTKKWILKHQRNSYSYRSLDGSKFHCVYSPQDIHVIKMRNSAEEKWTKTQIKCTIKWLEHASIDNNKRRNKKKKETIMSIAIDFRLKTMTIVDFVANLNNNFFSV